MHELSLAANIIEIVEAEFQKSQAMQLEAVEIEIGQLSGVIPEALDFAMQEAKKNTVLQNAEIVFHIREAVFRCDSCNHEFKAEDFYTPCSQCQSFETTLIDGNELKILRIRVV